MCNYEQVIEQFWKLNGEAICEEAYKALTEVLVEKTDSYEAINLIKEVIR